MSSTRVSLRLRPVFEGAKEPGIFSVPAPRGKLGIFSSPTTYMEETVRTVRPRTSPHLILHQQDVFEGGRSSGAYMEEIVRRMTPRFARCSANRLCSKDKEASNFSKSQRLRGSSGSKFLQVSASILRKKDWNFSISQGLYRRGENGIFPSPRA